MYIKHWESGDKYFSDYYSKHVKISNLFINNKISVFDKYRYPIIVNKKNDVLFIPNMYINPMLNNKLSLKLKV